MATDLPSTIRQMSSGGGGSPNIFGVNPGSKTYAGDTYAALTRQQWADYVNTFVPVENQLIQYATDPTQVTRAMASANADVDASFAAQEGATDRRLKGLGVSLSPEEQAAQKRSLGLNKSLAEVQGQNTARDMTVERQRMVLGNPAPKVG